MRAHSLFGKTDLDGILAGGEFNKPGHCLGNRFVGVFVIVFHRTTSTSPQWPSAQLNSYG